MFPNWGNIIESEINLSLDTKYEIDLDNDGNMESDGAEKEGNSLKHIELGVIFQRVSNTPPKREILRERPIYHTFSYSFLFIRKIERPPNFKLS